MTAVLPLSMMTYGGHWRRAGIVLITVKRERHRSRMRSSPAAHR
jgi:hypothetical protein